MGQSCCIFGWMAANHKGIWVIGPLFAAWRPGLKIGFKPCHELGWRMSDFMGNQPVFVLLELPERHNAIAKPQK